MINILTIAVNTFRESARSKIIYAMVLFASICIVVATFFGSVTIGNQILVIKDFGLFITSLFTVSYVVISGAALLQKELQRKTVYNILSKAISRSQFVFGKFLGLFFTACFLSTFLITILAAYLYIFESKIDYLLFYALGYMYFELLIVCAASMFFSSIVITPVLSGVFTFGLFLAGRSSSYLSFFTENEMLPIMTRRIFGIFEIIIPDLESLNVANNIIFLSLSDINYSQMLWSSLYSISYSLILLLLAITIFNKKEFNQ